MNPDRTVARVVFADTLHCEVEHVGFTLHTKGGLTRNDHDIVDSVWLTGVVPDYYRGDIRAAVLGQRCGITIYHESQKPEDFRAISPENALGMLLLLRDESGQSKREVSITVYAATDFMREIYEVVRQATRLRPRRLVFTAELDRCVADLNFRDEAHGDARVVAVKVLWEQNLRADHSLVLKP